ncbi:MAG: ribosomal protein L7/L12 [Chloroflexi bacterium]|nr:ribosomal protein L7/L12 [Chloroflexota bacterium]
MITISLEVAIILLVGALIVAWVANASRKRFQVIEDDAGVELAPKRKRLAAPADITSELERLFGLFQSGALTSDEYQKLKTQFLGEQTGAVPADLSARVERLIDQGRKIDAIKLYREETGLGLKEAKDEVERIERERRL